MTVLAGLWRFDRRPDAADCCARMLVAQELYGPHDRGQWAEGDVALGRQLMRLLPEDRFDHQPLIGGDGRYILVADVRLDNRDELTEALFIPASEARSLCDAAILLAAIERWDECCLEHLVGDYAFVVWDGARRRLLLARDPLGQRPLHYHRGNNFFAFASMPKGLHALSEVPYAPDEERIAEFLALIPESGSKSFFLGVERIEPGHLALVTENGFTTRRYWEPGRQRITLSRPEDYSDALRELLDKAVRCRLRGAEEVGVFLSGGFDSGAVAATAARLLAPSGKRVIAMTGVPRQGYDHPAPRNRIVDEARLAAATAALYPNMEHVLCRNKGISPFDNLDRGFYLYERPHRGLEGKGWSNSFNETVQKYKLKVTLSGQLGNLGLSYNGMELLPELFSQGHWFEWRKEAQALIAKRQMRWRGVLAKTFGPWCPPLVWIWLNKINGNALEIGDYAAINPQRLAELDLPSRAKAGDFDLVYRPSKDGVAMRVNALQSNDPGNYQKGTLGGWQFDQRDPTADIRLLEFCLAVPTEQFLRDGTPRALARLALADRLPKLVLDEHRRGLQVADWHEDLTAARGEITDELNRLEACSPATRAIDLPRLRRLVEQWPSGGWERDEIITPYRYALPRAISAGHFLRRGAGSNH